MAISVVGNQAISTLTYVKVRAAVAVVDPTTSVTYIAPVAGISYIEISVGAETDTSGRFQFVPEVVVATDGLRYVLAKLFGDSLSAVSATRIEFEKAPIQDSVALAETIAKFLTFFRTFSEAQGLTDATVLSIGRAIADAVTMVEQRSMSFSRPVFDTYTTNDNVAKSFSRTLTDSYAVAELYSMAFSRPVTDSAAVADAVLTVLHKTIFDSFFVQDDAIRFVQKLLGDGVAMNDGFDAGDGAVYSFSKGVSNVTIVADATAKTPSKGLTEQLALADSGYLVQQDYCDITYFADDYVGVKTLF